MEARMNRIYRADEIDAVRRDDRLTLTIYTGEDERLDVVAGVADRVDRIAGDRYVPTFEDYVVDAVWIRSACWSDGTPLGASEEKELEDYVREFLEGHDEYQCS